jgi:GT2 family glycosyltransferase
MNLLTKCTEITQHPSPDGVVTLIEHGPDLGDSRQLRTGVSAAICTYKRAASLRRLLDSLALQTRLPDELIIVDASPDADTEEVVRNLPDLADYATSFRYYRVAEPLRGLTRQRNFSLDLVHHDLLVWFDDDIVLEPSCLQEMEQTHRAHGGEIVGVGAHMQNESRELTMRWRLRRLLKLTPSLEPGRYFRSGMATPWRFLEPTDQVVPGDWLTGYAMMWSTAIARQVRLNSVFVGYSAGEDLDFSLRMGQHGKLCVAGQARADHLHEQSGRPDPYQLGRMSLKNAYSIHRSLPNRSWRDGCWFFYAYGMDTLLRLVALPRPGQMLTKTRFIFGRLVTIAEILSSRSSRE